MIKWLTFFYFLMLFVKKSLKSRKYKNLGYLLSFLSHKINCSAISIRKYSFKFINKRQKILPNQTSTLYLTDNKVNNLVINYPSLFSFSTTSRLKFLFNNIFIRLSILFVVEASLKVIFLHWSKRLINRDVIFKLVKLLKVDMIIF